MTDTAEIRQIVKRLSPTAERMARLEGEAQVLASLNHLNRDSIRTEMDRKE